MHAIPLNGRTAIMALTFIIPGLDEAASEKIIGILQNRLS